VRARSVRLGLTPAPSRHPSVTARADLPTRAPYRLGGPAPPDLPPGVPPSLDNGRGRDGTSNPLSIAYASRPRLRPASPAGDQHGCGTLGHPVGGIRTPLALLVPTFALPNAPDSLPLLLHRRWGRSPTTETRRQHPGNGRRSVRPPVRLSACPSRSAASAPGLAPVDCRRRGTFDQ
jgi:hypothetical protein